MVQYRNDLYQLKHILTLGHKARRQIEENLKKEIFSLFKNV